MELYEISKKLDLRQSFCPTTVAKTRLALTTISSGDILQVRLNPGEHMESVPPVLLNEGHQVLDIVKDGNSYLLYIVKH